MPLKDPEARREYDRQRYWANPERQAEAGRRYREAHREACLKRSREYCRKWRAAHPERYREIGRNSYHKIKREHPQQYTERAKQKREGVLRRQYNMTPAEYEDRFALQASVCAICGKPFGERRPHVDHDHTTKKVRGLLCMHCNQGLGAFYDDPGILRKAAAYLEAA